MNRICLSEETLSEYISGILPPEDRITAERHLVSCTRCRRLLAETHDIIQRPDIYEIRYKTFSWVRKNRWFIGMITAFVSSFLFPKYFLQFLAACLLMGGKWIINAKATKMLIMIRDAWKRGDKDKTDEVLSRFNSEK